MIFIGMLIFIMTPIYLKDSPEIGIISITFGFIIGGIGIYYSFIKKKRIN